MSGLTHMVMMEKGHKINADEDKNISGLLSNPDIVEGLKQLGFSFSYSPKGNLWLFGNMQLNSDYPISSIKLYDEMQKHLFSIKKNCNSGELHGRFGESDLDFGSMIHLEGLNQYGSSKALALAFLPDCREIAVDISGDQNVTFEMGQVLRDKSLLFQKGTGEIVLTSFGPALKHTMDEGVIVKPINLCGANVAYFRKDFKDSANDILPEEITYYPFEGCNITGNTDECHLLSRRLVGQCISEIYDLRGSSLFTKFIEPYETLSVAINNLFSEYVYDGNGEKSKNPYEKIYTEFKGNKK